MIISISPDNSIATTGSDGTSTKHQFRQVSERKIAGNRWVESGYVFTTPIGTPIDARNLIRDWHELRASAGIPETVRFHDLRHTAATLLLAEGVPLATISRILGHSGIAITADLYAHVGESLMNEAAMTMDRILNGPDATQVATQTRDHAPTQAETDNHGDVA